MAHLLKEAAQLPENAVKRAGILANVSLFPSLNGFKTEIAIYLSTA